MQLRSVLTFALLWVLPFAAGSQTAPSSQTPQAAAIQAVMYKSQADWNRGDLDSFVTCYKDSPDILFIGSRVVRGYAQMVETYRTNYGTSEKRGVLTYTQLEVQPLDARFATMTGHFHLERHPAVTVDGAIGNHAVAKSNVDAPEVSNQDGYFLLVFEYTKQGWKIVRDNTTSTTKP